VNPTTRTFFEQEAIFRTLIRQPGKLNAELRHSVGLGLQCNLHELCRETFIGSSLHEGAPFSKQGKLKRQMQILVRKSFARHFIFWL
jgi:hypothetical protein